MTDDEARALGVKVATDYLADLENLKLAAERWLAAQREIRAVQLEAERLLREAIIKCR